MGQADEEIQKPDAQIRDLRRKLTGYKYESRQGAKPS
jgi:hypothetical protein